MGRIGSSGDVLTSSTQYDRARAVPLDGAQEELVQCRRRPVAHASLEEEHRERLTRAGHRFHSDCDSEIIAVYLAEQMSRGRPLEEAMHQSLQDLDGVFTYICVTEDSLGVAKD